MRIAISCQQHNRLAGRCAQTKYTFNFATIRWILEFIIVCIIYPTLNAMKGDHFVGDHQSVRSRIIFIRYVSMLKCLWGVEHHTKYIKLYVDQHFCFEDVTLLRYWKDWSAHRTYCTVFVAQGASNDVLPLKMQS